jgi:hypothetical protein
MSTEDLPVGIYTIGAEGQAARLVREKTDCKQQQDSWIESLVLEVASKIIFGKGCCGGSSCYICIPNLIIPVEDVV